MIWDGGKFVFTVPLDKQTVFTLHAAPGYTAFTAYCDAVGYDPYLHDDKTDCISDKIAVFDRPVVTHSTPPPPLH